MSAEIFGSYQNNYVPVSTQEPREVDIEDLSASAIVVNGADPHKTSRKSLYIAITIVTSLLASVAILISQSSGALSEGGDLLLAFDRTIPFRSVDHPEKPTTLWGTASKPYPTGAFWTNFVVKEGDGPVGLLPYGIKTLSSGVQVSYGATRRVVNKVALMDTFYCDLEISAKETYVSRYVQRWDNISVTMKYDLAGTASMVAPLVKGSPFITVNYANATPVVRFDIMHILSFEPLDSEGIETGGNQYIVTLGNWQKWLIYISKDKSGAAVDLVRNDDALALSQPYSGYIRVSNLPLQNTKEAASALLVYIRRYPVGGQVLFSSVAGSQASDLTIHYSAQGPGPLLTTCLPHHVELMKVPDLRRSDHTRLQQILVHAYYSTKGRMTPVIGESWTVRYPLVQVGWKYSRVVGDEPINTEQMDEIADNLLEDVQKLIPSAPDPYAFGKQLGRMAVLALIADELGVSDARQIALSNLKTTLTPWLLGQNQNPLMYVGSVGLTACYY